MKTMKKQKKYLSYDQHQLKHLSDVVCDDIENLLSHLGITSYRMLDKMVITSCPIHGGDNDSAFNLYHQGDSYRGNWKCRTHQCEETFKSSIIGFIRGCLSHENGWSKPGDPVVSFAEALKYAIDFSKSDLANIKVSKKAKEKSTFINAIKNIQPTDKAANTSTIPRTSVIKALSIPSSYFLNRGFSAEILKRYDVGDCLDPNKEMHSRAVVPVYNDSGQYMIGCTGRTIYDKCGQCSGYHGSESSCPSDNDTWKYSKWRHNKNFKTQECLYNYWFAKDHISSSHTVVLVESPGNVWRLEEAGIHNSVAIFGASLSHKQKMLLDISGAMNIVTIMDNDQAGQAAAKNIEDKCCRTYNIKHIQLTANDIADMTIEQIHESITPQLKGYIL
jgi:hypothetical protein